MAKTIEELKAQSAEVKNASVVGENTATRVGTLFTDIVEHVEAYEAGQAQKDTEQSTSINAETARAMAAETTLSERINQEVTDRKAMDETIGVQLSNEIERAKEMELGITTKLNDEIERATEAENNLQEKITSEAEARDLAINTEAQARTKADKELTDKLTTIGYNIYDFESDNDGDAVSLINETTGDEVLLIDNEGNVILNNIKTSSIENVNSVLLKISNTEYWNNKNVLIYGDSITEMSSNGDWNYPFTNRATWGHIVAQHLHLATLRGRGVGGTAFQWYNNYRKVAYVNADTGVIKSVSNTTFEDAEEVEGLVKSRTIGCSWNRITTMIPASIKDKINLIIIFFNNDYVNIESEPTWVANSNIDTEWSNSEYYANYGGDYNILDFQGAILSTVMKIQAWMPNTKIIVMNVLSGYNPDNPKKDPENAYNGKGPNNYIKSTIIPNICHRLSIPCIDTYGNCGINQLNRGSMLADYIHPNNYGHKKIAECVLGAMHSIYPPIN